jgi:hypothetical protein
MSDVHILAKSKYDWDSLRATVDKIMPDRPDNIINSSPVNFSDEAITLLYLGCLYGYDISNATGYLKNCPRNLMSYLNYTFMVACDNDEYENLMYITHLDIIRVKNNNFNFLIVSGPLSEWFDTIIQGNDHLIYNQFYILLEREGLGFIFSNYRKIPSANTLFKLEKK